ncbi:MAG: phospholipase D-like domain-containing protein [Candidatus Firestonebacteria bacterium]
MSKLDFFKTYKSFFNFISNVESELIIICPFIKIAALKKIIENVPLKVKIIIIVRWKIFDIVSGVSDLEIYNYLKKRNYNLYVNNDIHLKVLVKDKREILLGSANITNSGLGLIKDSNIEAISMDHLTFEDLSNVIKILKTSIKVTDETFKKICENVDNFNDIKDQLIMNSNKINACDKNIFVKKSENILVTDFPFSNSPDEFLKNVLKKRFNLPEVEHDMALFGLDEKEPKSNLRNKLKRHFIFSDAFLWQSSIIENETLFGKYSHILHNALMDDPKPYRKRVKELVLNMFNWTQEFSSDYIINKYKHSNSISKK